MFGHDDIVRGMGQLSEALACGFKTAALATSVQHSKRVKSSVFKNGLIVLAVASKAETHKFYSTYLCFVILSKNCEIEISLETPDPLILTGMQIYHNFIRPHMGLKGMSPAEVAGIKIEGESKWLAIIQNAKRETAKS